MTRIVAGAARGRRLRVPSGEMTRPTSDRVREAMFSALESMLGGFHGLRVLDLYAGSGALGLEALSRGATCVTLVESEARAVRTIEANLAAVGIPGATVVRDRVERFLSSRVRDLPDVPGEPLEQSAPEGPGSGPTRPSGVVELEEHPGTPSSKYDVVLADPPYALTTDDLHDALRWLTDGWLEAEAVLVVERDHRSGPVRWPDGVNGLRDRAYGETVLWYGRSAGTDVPG